MEIRIKPKKIRTRIDQFDITKTPYVIETPDIITGEQRVWQMPFIQAVADVAEERMGIRPKNLKDLNIK